ncbi:MAG: ABC transporter permease [Chloroflexi bacterium]|nr:ABC transporter permease [Chloroflexota bacterium]
MRMVIEKRKSVSRKAIYIVPIASFVSALILGSILLLITGVNPITTYAAMIKGAFGSMHALSETLVKATPLMLTGLGVAIAFRMRFWNIGAEGQFVFGGIAGAGIALFFSEIIPSWLVLPMALVGGMLAGALWAGIPAALNAYLGINESLTTLMLNYVAVLFASYLYYGPWRDPLGFGFPGTARFPEEAWLPRIFGRVHFGMIFALIAALILWFILNRTRWGFELKVIGENKTTAKYLGIKISKNIVVALLLSGAISGLGGASEVTGISRRLQAGLAVGHGYTAIIVAWLAQLNPIAVIFVAIMMAALLVGGDQVQITMGLPAAVGLVLQGLILFPMLAGSLFTEYRLKIIRPDTPPSKERESEA